MTRRALITGITGQDGAYLARLLLAQGYEVHGMVRRSSTETFERIADLHDQIQLHQADLLDQLSLVRVLEVARPNELYNLAAQSFVPISFQQPLLTGEFTALGVTRMLEATRLVDPTIRFYQASSSEMFGNVRCEPQTEETPFWPRSPYGVAKVYGHWITVNYRESHNLFACSGILFNHESPRRGSNFVTSKIVKGAIAIATGKATELRMGNLDARRDWGHAKDYVEAMWMLLQAEKPDDYCCATGISHSVRDCCEYVFGKLDLDFDKYYVLDERYLRPEELRDLKGDSSRIREELGWNPKYTFETLMDDMIESDENYPNIKK